MRVETLVLHNFRNYSHLELKLDAHLNILVGENAQGKTNFLEAVNFSALARSFRTRNEEELVRWGSESCTVVASVQQRLQLQKLRVSYDLQTRKKKYFCNGVELSRAAYLGRVIPVLFTPEDLAVVKGSPQLRRKFFDELIGKISPLYEQDLSRYQQILRQRNQLLKTQREKVLHSAELASWNEQLIKQGSKVIAKRSFAVHRLGLLARLAHRSLTDREETLTVDYLSSIGEKITSPNTDWEEKFAHALDKHAGHECRMGQTLIGPHRDDILLAINDKNARIYASQGQQRTLILALKLAEIEFIKSETGEFPILLLDDVFSELDSKRRQLLVAAIEGKVQTIITGTAAERLGVLHHDGKLFIVQGGEVRTSDPHSSNS
ncbi:MAG TPA: DNA replication/repair protein RecF [Oscillospiraceae bacterium]|nr:DNA replication/repair protein RecF [Oscillospiraceae bacterium]